MASGLPNEAEVQAQWRAVVDILDKTQVYADSLCGATNEFETLIGSLKGDFTPGSLAAWADTYRSGLSSLVDPSLVYQAIAPCIMEYGKVLKAGSYVGSGFETVELMIGAIYDRFLKSTVQFVESREIAHDLAGARTGTGNGTISRLVVDENNFEIENCHVEDKVFRCTRDQNSGAKEYAEEFTMLAETRSKDHLEQHSFGSGDTQRRLLYNKNAGSSHSGSIARNSSFESYDVSATNDFTYWELVSGTVPTQDTSNYYTSHPGASTNYSLTASAAFRLKQSLVDLRRSKLDSRKPYFLRVMTKRIGGTADGNVVLHLGSRSVSASADNANWYELMLPLDQNSWFKNFNQDDFNIEIERTGSSGTVIFDDLIFCPLDQIDSTWWVCRMAENTTVTSWLRDDEIKFEDSQSDLTKGKINYYLFRAGLGYLPHANVSGGACTFTDP